MHYNQLSHRKHFSAKRKSELDRGNVIQNVYFLIGSDSCVNPSACSHYTITGFSLTTVQIPTRLWWQNLTLHHTVNFYFLILFSFINRANCPRFWQWLTLFMIDVWYISSIYIWFLIFSYMISVYDWLWKKWHKTSQRKWQIQTKQIISRMNFRILLVALKISRFPPYNSI